MRVINAILTLITFLPLPCVHCCPENTYPLELSCASCPSHTVSLENSTSVRDCKCEPGFVCMYYRQIRATVSLNATMDEFMANANNVRLSFISGIAAAAGVTEDHVTINHVATRLRRMLGSEGRNSPGIHIHAIVRGSDLLTNLDWHLGSMHIGHSWKSTPGIIVIRRPQELTNYQND